MFDMSWGEVMVIGTVALIVIGPKDLPKALRTVGQATAKLRRMAAEFQHQFNEAMREAELDDVKKEVEGINRSVSSLNTNFDPIQTIRDEIKGAIDEPVTPPSDLAQPSSPAIGAGHETNPASPADAPSVASPVAPLPPIEPHIPGTVAAETPPVTPEPAPSPAAKGSAA